MNTPKQCRECCCVDPVDGFQECLKKHGTRKYRSVCKPCWKIVRSKRRIAKTLSIKRMCRECGQNELAYKKQVCEDCQRKQKRESVSAYQKANPDKRRVWEKSWRDAHPESIAAKKQRYNDKYKDAILSKKRIYYAENREERRDAANKARLKNIDKARESARAQYQANKEVYLTNARNRKARLKSAKGTHTKSEVLVLWASQNKRCAVPRCKFPIAAIGKDKYHVDHIVALINGGTNDISNLQILCRTHNCSKQAKKPEEWAKAIGLLFV